MDPEYLPIWMRCNKSAEPYLGDGFTRSSNLTYNWNVLNEVKRRGFGEHLAEKKEDLLMKGPNMYVSNIAVFLNL
jgi:hypothetical protein